MRPMMSRPRLLIDATWLTKYARPVTSSDTPSPRIARHASSACGAMP